MALGGGLVAERRASSHLRRSADARSAALRASLATASPAEWRGIPTAWPDPGAAQGDPSRAVVSRAVPLAATGAVGAALVHLVVMPTHFAEWWLYGVFFLLAALVQIAWAVTVAFRPTRALLGAGAAGSAAVVALWLVTRTVAVPVGPGAGTTEAVSGLDVLATCFELVTVAAAVTAYRAGRGARLLACPPAQWGPRLRVTGVAALVVTAAVATVAPVR